MTRGGWRAAIALLAAGGGKIEQTISGRRDFTIDPTIEYQEVKFKEVVDKPSAFKGLNIDFPALFYRHDETVWNHFYTPFVSEDYKSFSVWFPETRIWELNGFLSSIPTLYLRKECGYIAELLEARPYSLVRIRGVVRTDYENRPWIDVHRVNTIEADVFTEESLRSMIAGMNDARERRPAPARERLEAALKGKLSAAARFDAHMKLGQLYEDINDFVKAMAHFQSALSLRAGDTAAREGYERNFKWEEQRRQIEARREAEERNKPPEKQPEEKQPEEKKP